MSSGLTKPLIVPEYSNALVKLYKPAGGTPTADPSYTINVQNVLNSILGNPALIAAPNACAILNDDLFVSLSSGSSQSILKFPGYLQTPSTAITNAFIFSLDGSDYVGMAFDKSGNLYAAEGSYTNNYIYKYTGANVGYPGAAQAKNDNYATRSQIGNAGITSYFGDLVFDTAGNLWIADYLNHRVVVFDAANLGGTNSYHVLNSVSGSIAVANTNASLNQAAAHLFAEPEGIDFDAQGNLWVANNNDGGGSGGVQNNFTSLVKISPALQTAVLASVASGSVTPAAGDANSKYYIYQVPASSAGRAQFGGLRIDRSAGRLFVNEEVAGDGRWYDIASLAAITTASGTHDLSIVSTNPGNGGIALVNRGLYIPDDTTDAGYEPNTTTTIGWESPFISVTQNSAGGMLSTLPAYEDVRGGDACYVYVQIKNAGLIASTGTETLQLYWGKASAGLAWPQPWDGTVFDTSPYTSSAMGGLIGSPLTLDPIPAGGSAIISIPWSVAPDPSKYTVADGHFCLLVRIQTSSASPYGMTYPETSSILENTLDNGKIAWRNIHIINPLTNMIRYFPNILAANYTGIAVLIRLGFELLNAEGLTVTPAGGQFLISAKGDALAALREAARDNRNLREVGENEFALIDLTAGIEGLTLQPGAFLILTAHYHPEQIPVGYAIRATQYTETATGETLVGGQTFVFGNVVGFPVKQHKPKKKSPPWIWLLLILLLLLIFLVVILK